MSSVLLIESLALPPDSDLLGYELAEFAPDVRASLLQQCKTHHKAR